MLLYICQNSVFENNHSLADFLHPPTYVRRVVRLVLPGAEKVLSLCPGGTGGTGGSSGASGARPPSGAESADQGLALASLSLSNTWRRYRVVPTGQLAPN